MPPRFISDAERLLILQKEARERHRNKMDLGKYRDSIFVVEKIVEVVKPKKKIKKPKTGKKKIKLQKIARPVGRPKKDKTIRVDFKHKPMPMFAPKPKPEKIIWQEPKPFTRPPAIYSNTSPYGIAAEMLLEQLKQSG